MCDQALMDQLRLCGICWFQHGTEEPCLIADFKKSNPPNFRYPIHHVLTLLMPVCIYTCAQDPTLALHIALWMRTQWHGQKASW